ncbi:MAG: HlyD family secretion protein [Steroidobacteraceae bacterium]
MDAPVQEFSAAAAATEAAELAAASRRRSRLRWSLMGGGVLLALVLALAYYLFTGRYVSTDDSSVQAAQTSISSNVPGRVIELDVHDNQTVQRGQLLFRLDERPFRIAVEDAQAKLEAARMQIGAAKATYRQQLASVAAARATLAYQQHEFERQQHLLQSGISSRAQFEQTQHALELAQSQLTSSQQQVGSVLALLGGNPDLPVDQHPVVQEAQAALDKANLDLSYTVVKAPDDGIAAKVEQLQVGDYITAATPVFSLISNNDIWVEANFKEDELTYMKPGQSADVRIDAYPGRRFKAHVTSLSPGTGAQFSLLPPENATGNWVKVVQRVPVRLQLDDKDLDGVPLHAGLSVVVTVDTQHRRHLFGGSGAEVALR